MLVATPVHYDCVTHTLVILEIKGTSFSVYPQSGLS